CNLPPRQRQQRRHQRTCSFFRFLIENCSHCKLGPSQRRCGGLTSCRLVFMGLGTSVEPVRPYFKPFDPSDLPPAACSVPTSAKDGFREAVRSYDFPWSLTLVMSSS